MKIIVKATDRKKIIVPKGYFASDLFICTKCGYEALLRVYPGINTATCSECGGLMRRQ